MTIIRFKQIDKIGDGILINKHEECYLAHYLTDIPDLWMLISTMEELIAHFR